MDEISRTVPSSAFSGSGKVYKRQIKRLESMEAYDQD